MRCVKYGNVGPYRLNLEEHRQLDALPFSGLVVVVSVTMVSEMVINALAGIPSEMQMKPVVLISIRL